ncbi:MAG: hypothetical protein BAJALOKI1v1_30040 [Promethearchaeota archaeon]|nr:MAG: hypothetical protein BAJALOKI1v1_30040 [Candidatus Lokiarchaeota archaeon]
MDLNQYKGLDLVTYCGLWCGACPSFHRGRCKGCRTTENKNPKKKKCGYGIRKCCKDRGIEYCGQCDAYPCSKINRLITSQKGRKEYDYRHNIPQNFQMIKKEGFEKWLQYQQEKWKCGQCGGHGVFYNLICWECKNPVEL